MLDGMTNEEAKKKLEAKKKCLIAETSGTNHDCNMQLCDECPLNYEQGNMGEQKQVLDLAIKALEQTDILDKIRAEIEQIELLASYTRGDIKHIALDIIDKYRKDGGVDE